MCVPDLDRALVCACFGLIVGGPRRPAALSAMAVPKQGNLAEKKCTSATLP